MTAIRDVLELTSDIDKDPERTAEHVLALGSEATSHHSIHRTSVDVVVTRIYTRLRNMCEQYGIGDAVMSPDLRVHGKNIVFLAAAIPRVMQSIEHRQHVIGILNLFICRVHRYNDISCVPELLIASNWMNYPYGMKVAMKAMSLIDTRGRLSKRRVLMNALFESLIPEFVNNAILAMALDLCPDIPRQNVCTTDECMMEAIAIVESRWDEIQKPLSFTKTDHISGHDDHMHRVYFVTHVILMANQYGNSTVSTLLSGDLQIRLFRVLSAWFVDITTRPHGIQKNRECFGEIAYCLLYVQSDVLPGRFWTCFTNELIRGTTTAFENAPFGHSTPQNVFFPDDTRIQGFMADYHAHMIMLCYFTEGYRHHSFKQKPCRRTFVFPPYDENDHGTVWESLHVKGYVKMPAYDLSKRWDLNDLRVFSDRLMELVIRQRPKYKELLFDLYANTSITPPHSVDSEFNQAVVTDCAFPLTEFVAYMTTRIARQLGIDEQRVLIFADKTYVRVKAQNVGTKSHSDVYYFVESTDLLNRVYGTMPEDEKSPLSRCVVCKRDAGTRFDYIRICRDCLNGHIPLYTAWISLGDYTNARHSLLQFIPTSNTLEFGLSPKEIREELPRTSSRMVNKGMMWTYPTPEHIRAYDVLLFNAKTIHRAVARNRKNTRISIDVRFGIRPV
jgi:hypothetical protein